MAQEGFLKEVMFDLGLGMQRSSGRVGSRRDRKHSQEAWRNSYASIHSRQGKLILRAGMARKQYAQTRAMEM